MKGKEAERIIGSGNGIQGEETMRCKGKYNGFQWKEADIKGEESMG